MSSPLPPSRELTLIREAMKDQEDCQNSRLYQDPLIATHGCRTGSALADNVHRSVRLGAPVLISESWYYIHGPHDISCVHR